MTKKFCSEQEENEFLRKYYEGLSKYLEKKGYIVGSQRYENIINVHREYRDDVAKEEGFKDHRDKIMTFGHRNREKKQLNKEVNKK